MAGTAAEFFWSSAAVCLPTGRRSVLGRPLMGKTQAQRHMNQKSSYFCKQASTSSFWQYVIFFQEMRREITKIGSAERFDHLVCHQQADTFHTFPGKCSWPATQIMEIATGKSAIGKSSTHQHVFFSGDIMSSRDKLSFTTQQCIKKRPTCAQGINSY